MAAIVFDVLIVAVLMIYILAGYHSSQNFEKYDFFAADFDICRDFREG